MNWPSGADSVKTTQCKPIRGSFLGRRPFPMQLHQEDQSSKICKTSDPMMHLIIMQLFSPTRPHWAELVSKSPCPCVCLCVCVCHRQTPTSRGRVDLWSNIAFLILVWDDTIFKKRGCLVFFPRLLGFGPPPQKKHPFPEVV